MSKQLKQVIGLSKKTGDRIIVFDNSEPDNSFVVMTLDQYEDLMGVDDSLTEKKIIDKIDNNEYRNSGNNSNGRNSRSNNWRIPPQVKEESED